MKETTETLPSTVRSANISSNIAWNVVNQNEFQDRVRTIFAHVAKMLTNTLGPSGANTIIQKFGDVHITKDGWNIIKNIHFEEGMDNTIMKMLSDISAQVVIKVGDGSTSSIVAANELLKCLDTSPDLKGIRPKELMDRLSKIAQELSVRILKKSHKIDIKTAEGLDAIRKLALISTNGDAVTADTIRAIYAHTGNPTIEYIKSRTNETRAEIINGYKAPLHYLDQMYVNNTEDASCDINNPLILMFDHRIDKENHFDKIISRYAQLAIEYSRRLVVFAPRFDDVLLNYIRTTTNMEFKATNTSTIVYARASLVNPLYQSFFEDFAVMTGGDIIRDSDIDALFYASDVESGRVIPAENSVIPTADWNSKLGEVGFVSIGAMNTTIRGFHKRNEGMYERAMIDAVSKYNKMVEANADLNTPGPQEYELKKRVAKLRGSMGVIHVGGNSMLEKVTNYDLVEDAVKACESAFVYGHNIGGSLIVAIAANELASETNNEVDKAIYALFAEAFKNVFGKVVKNKYFDQSDEYIKEIVERSVDDQMCYNLVTDEYSGDVINPCYTDIEIVKATTSIISMLYSSNQFLVIPEQR